MIRASLSYWSMHEVKEKKVNWNISTSLGWDGITQTQPPSQDLYLSLPMLLRRDETGDKRKRAWSQEWFRPWYWNKHKHLILISRIIHENWSPWYLESGQFTPLKYPTCMKESAWRLPYVHTHLQTNFMISQIWAFLGWHFFWELFFS